MNLQDAQAYSPPAWLLDGQGGARPLDREALARWQPADGQVWIDLDEDSERDWTWLETKSGLAVEHREPFVRERAWPSVRVPGPGQLFLLMRVPNPDAPYGAFALLRLWIEPKRAITMCTRAFTPKQGVNDRLETGRGPAHVGALLLLVVEFMTAQLHDRVLELQAAIIDLEHVIERAQLAPEDQLHQLRLQAITLQRYANPQRALLRHLRSLDLAWLLQDYDDSWRAIVKNFGEGSRELDALVEHARDLQQSLAGRSSEQLNRRVYVLTVVSTILLPLTLITGLLGTNISTVDGNILGARHPLWFVALCVGLVLLGWGIYWGIRRRWSL
jgi:zinc transporter